MCPFQSLTQLTCSYEAENQTRYLVCDLGNPMKSGTSVRANKTHMLFLAFPTLCVSVQLSQVDLPNSYISKLDMFSHRPDKT